jgi:hypothetical protein
VFERSGVLPRGLDEMAPGPGLGVILSGLRVSELSGHEQVVVLRAHQRMASHYQGKVYEDLAAVFESIEELDHHEDPDLSYEAAAAEIRAALRLGRRAADADLALALDLGNRLPSVLAALAAGRIDLRRARTILSGTAHLPEETARRLVDQVIARAPRLTTGQLAAWLRRLCIEMDPAEAKDRYLEAHSQRRVVTEPTPAGTAHLLGLELEPDRVEAILARIDSLAQGLKTKTETRTLDQLRADVFLDLLEGKAQGKGGKGGGVELRVDLKTLAGLAEGAGELSGYGPVIAEIARRVAADQPGGEWRYVLTHPETGEILDTGLLRLRPLASQRRRVEMRDPVCVFPGCRRPARDCDLDHRIPWAVVRRTRTRDLAPLCRHDHVIRHRAGWRYRRLPIGDYLWISRLGHAYTTSGEPP